MIAKEKFDGMILRPMGIKDLPFMLEVRNQSKEMLNDNRAFNIDECIEWWYNTLPENYVVSIAGDDVGIMRVRRCKQSISSAEIGGDIHESYRRRGFALRAYKLLIPYLFNDLLITELFLEVLAINMPAFNLYRKLGFSIHEYKPEMAKRILGYLDGFVMNITKEKWEDLYGK